MTDDELLALVAETLDATTHTFTGQCCAHPAGAEIHKTRAVTQAALGLAPG